MPPVSATARNADNDESFETVSALEQSLASTEPRLRLKTYVAMADRLIATLEAGGNWHEAAHQADAVAVSAGELGLLTMSAAVKTFAAAVRQDAACHTQRNAAQMIVIEHEHLRVVLESLHPGWMA